jgi:hypothetical protein
MLKIGDKVKMTKRGFIFYANVDTSFDMFSVGGKMSHENYTSAICQQFAIHGVGTIKRFNDEGSPLVRWEFSIDGMEYHYSHYFDKKDIRKLTLLEKLKRIL